MDQKSNGALPVTELETFERDNVFISRPVFTQDEFDEGFESHDRPFKSPKDRLVSVSKKYACSGQCCRNFLFNALPFLKIMRHYNPKVDSINDIIAGLTIGVMHIPQGMAYAMLATLSPVYGLYTSLWPITIYFFFGTSKHISIGTLAVVSLMTGNALDRQNCDQLVEPSSSSIMNMTNSSGVDSSMAAAELECRVKYACAMTFLGGLFQLGMGICRLGFVTIYMSDSLIRGFMTGSAFHVFTSQMKNFLGIKVPSHSGPLKLIYTYIDIFKDIQKINWFSFGICLITIVILYLIKEYVNPKVKAKIRMPLPIELAVVVLWTVLSWAFNFQGKFDLNIVGEIPTGIPAPRIPGTFEMKNIVMDALVISIVGFALSVSMASIFAKKHNYQIDANQEFIGYGLANIGGSFLNCFLSGASLSRSSVQEGANGKTQLAGVISAGLLVMVLLFIAHLFETLPNACLAAIIMVALKSLFLQFKDLPVLWRQDKFDFTTWVVVCLATVFLDVDIGLFIGLAFGIATVIYRSQKVYTTLLGRIPGTEVYKDIRVYPEAQIFDRIKIFRFDSALFFANKVHFTDKLYAKVGFKPLKLKAAIAKSKAATSSLVNGSAKSIKDQQDSMCIPQADIDTLIIDGSMIGFIDTDGVKALKTVVKDFADVNIDVLLAGFKAGPRESLRRTGFFDDNANQRDRLFVTVHDAVLSTRNQPSTEEFNSKAEQEV